MAEDPCFFQEKGQDEDAEGSEDKQEDKGIKSIQANFKCCDAKQLGDHDSQSLHIKDAFDIIPLGQTSKCLGIKATDGAKRSKPLRLIVFVQDRKHLTHHQGHQRIAAIQTLAFLGFS